MSIAATSAVTGASTASGKGKKSLSPSDFVNLMVTQLKNQDPMNPTSNSELLGQMSQIGQLQSSQDLQTSLKGMVSQNQIASAGNLIGKTVAGYDDDGDIIEGIVTGVRMANDSVYLELDTGQTMNMDHLELIEGSPVSAG